MNPEQQAARWLADVRPHKEQLDVWADELIADLAMRAGFFAQDYDAKITAQRDIREKLTLSADHCRDNVLAALAAAVSDDLAEAGKVLEGVTPGPWVEIHGDVFAPGQDLPVALVSIEAAPDARFIAWTREGVPALLARIAAMEAQIEGLQRTYEELYADALADAKSDAQEFDSDLWKMVRAYLDDLHFDWRDFMEDGVTADEAMTHIRECMNEETRRAEAAETALAAMTKERDELAAQIAKGTRYE